MLALVEFHVVLYDSHSGGQLACRCHFQVAIILSGHSPTLLTFNDISGQHPGKSSKASPCMCEYVKCEQYEKYEQHI